MARYEYPWDKLDRIGRKFIVDFPARASEKEKARIERRIRSIASYHQRKDPKVCYIVSREKDDGGNTSGISVKRVSPKPVDIRVE